MITYNNNYMDKFWKYVNKLFDYDLYRVNFFLTFKLE